MPIYTAHPADRRHGFLTARVADYMTMPVLTLAPETPLREIERYFGLHDFNGFPVVDRGTLVGMLTKFDVLKVFAPTPRRALPSYEELSGQTATHIMTRDVITFRPETPLPRVLQTVVDFRVKSFPILDGQQLAGIIARQDIVRALHESGAN